MSQHNRGARLAGWAGRLAVLTSVVISGALVGCGPDTALCTAGACVPCDCETGCASATFEPHTRASFADEADLLAWCGRPEQGVACKTIVTGLAGGTPAMQTYDRDFFALHDEWYWYHLLNGAPLPDCPRKPLAGMSFASISAIYAAAKAMPKDDLPMDLLWAGDRLYSPHFYDITLRGPNEQPPKVRHWVPGTLRFYAANPARKIPTALWTFEFEHSDSPLNSDVQLTMQTLRARLPTSVSAKLYWLARSTPWQEAMAAELGQNDPVLKGRCLIYTDLLVPGEVQVVHAGITAGVLRKVPKAELATVLPTRDEIVVLEGVPDDLAPVAGILTATPQAAQAHIALLAKARGTPDAYVEGIFEDPVITQWAHTKQPVILQLVVGEKPRFKAMTWGQWAEWLQIRDGKGGLTVPTVDASRLPAVWRVRYADDTERKRLIPIIGGKAAGLSTLIRRGAPDTPPDAMALTVKGYANHIAGLTPSIAALLARPEMAGEHQHYVWWRVAVLEGKAAFLARNTADPDATTWLEAMLANPGTPDFVKQAVLTGGVRGWVLQQPMDPGWLAEVMTALEARWGGVAVTQGLRFRSSATVEDIEGFSAAGVYSSHTGYLRPWLHPKSSEHSSSVERAIRRVWSAYWRFEAVEERRIAGIDHLTGRMAVLVHPNFGDELESANGVVIVTVSGASAKLATGATAKVETIIEGQIGALSVTNPPISYPHTPERTIVTQLGDGPPVWARAHASSETAVVLTETEALALHKRLRPVALRWLAEGNTRVADDWQRRTMQLDVEWRRVKAGWPQLKPPERGASAPVWPARMVLKQARPLNPRRRLSSAALEGHGAPGDIFDAALEVSKISCSCGPRVLTYWLVQTDPAWPIWPFAEHPFVAFIQSTGAPGTSGQPTLQASHVSITHAATTLSPFAADVTFSADMAAIWGGPSVSVTQGGDCKLGPKVLISGSQCTTEALAGGAQAWLKKLLDA